MPPRKVVQPQLGITPLPFVQGTSTTIHDPTPPSRKTFIRVLPPPKPQQFIVSPPPIRSFIFFFLDLSQSAPPPTARQSLILPPQHPETRRKSLMVRLPIQRIPSIRQAMNPLTPQLGAANLSTLTDPPMHPALPPPSANSIRAAPHPTQEPIPFRVKWANITVPGGEVQD